MSMSRALLEHRASGECTLIAQRPRWRWAARPRRCYNSLRKARMADLSIEFAGIKSPNPFWLASAPPTNTGDQVMRAFDLGWGGAVWKTLGDPIVDTSSRFGSLDVGGQRMVGFNNIELITDRPLDVNLREMRQVKNRYPRHAVIASLMVEKREDWRDIIQAVIDH